MFPPPPRTAYTGPVTATAKDVREDALAIPGEDRRRIGEPLLDSASTATAEEIETEWISEAVRRAEELERGEVEALDGAPVLADLRAKLQGAAQ